MTMAERSQAGEALQDPGRMKPNGKRAHQDLAERSQRRERAAPEIWQNEAKPSDGGNGGLAERSHK
jgi:hypothetical protein